MESVGELNERLRERAAGRLFGRWAKAVALATMTGKDVEQIAAEHRWIEADVLKSAVSADTTGTSTLSYALRQSLAELETNFSAVRRLQPGFRSVAPNTAIIATTAGATAGWVREGAAVPMSRQSSSTRSTLQPLRLGALSVVTEELAQLSDSEQIISTDHARARDPTSSTPHFFRRQMRAARKNRRYRSRTTRANSLRAETAPRTWTVTCCCSSTNSPPADRTCGIARGF